MPVGGATGVTLTDILPSGVTYVSGTPSCTNNQGTVTCLLGTLASGTATATIVVTAQNIGALQNVVGVVASEYDPNMANNHAMVTTIVGQPTFQIMTDIQELCVASTLPYVPQRYLFVAAGGTPPYTWSMSGQPDWLVFDPLKHQLDIGTPPDSTKSKISFSVTVTDATGKTATRPYDIPVTYLGGSCGPVFRTTASDLYLCPGDTPNACFNAQTFAGGSVSKQWEELTIDPNGNWKWSAVVGDIGTCLAHPAPSGGTYRMLAADMTTVRYAYSSPITISFGDPIKLLRIAQAGITCQGTNINLNQYVDAIGADLQVAFDQQQADGSWLAINPLVTLTSPSTFRARLTSPCVAPVVSSTFFFDVQPKPSFTQVPTDRTFCAGQSVTLTASANASGTFTWQGLDATGKWVPLYTNYPSQSTTSSFTVTPTVATTYKVSFGTTACGSIDSGAFTLTPVALPAISSTWATPAVTCAGYPSDLSASAVNATSVKWQSWNGTAYVDIPGATTYTYRTPILTSNATYRFVASNSCGTVNAPVSVTVNPVPPVAISGTACSLAAGQSATLTANTDMGLSPRFLWSPGGQTTQQITVTPAATTTYTCTVTIPYTGCWKTASYTVAVGSQITTPVFTAYPQNVTVCGGAPGATLSTGATGTNLAYQWQKQNPDTTWSGVAGATAASYTAPAANAVYRVQVSNTCGTITSPPATVTVSSSQSAAIVTPPASQTYCTSGSATLSVAATGTGLTYQWQWLNQYSQWVTGYPYPSTSTPSISVTPTVPTQFRVVVSNACNSVTSAAVVVSPSPPVTITQQPVGGTYCANYIYARLTVLDTGAPDLTYQWQLSADGVTYSNIANARSNQYTALTGGYYRCVLTSACGTIVSAVAPVGYVNCGF